MRGNSSRADLKFLPSEISSLIRVILSQGVRVQKAVDLCSVTQENSRETAQDVSVSFLFMAWLNRLR